ncbi:hypothetical protein TNCV_163491 [Trichonephila clavipes]|nr:hypothetical protein TNCV_163491 [Trichonephila clavipes]
MSLAECLQLLPSQFPVKEHSENGMGWGFKKNDGGRRIPGVYPRIIKQKKLSQLSKVSQERREWKTNLQSPPADGNSGSCSMKFNKVLR